MNNKMGGGQENILPDATGLFYALRSMGYENTAAIADLVDNSIDAGASNIWISVDKDLSKIFIADDGSGMSEDELRRAIKLGGKKAHADETDLGKYGLGLITASLSIGRVIRIITKKDGIYNTAVLDYDEIQERNLFIADFHESTENEIISFDYRTKDSKNGTVLIIDKCDKIQYTKAKDLINAINESMSEVFRVYLSEGKSIYLNESSVIPYDPLLLIAKGNQKLVDTDIVIKSKTGAEGKMHVLAVKVPDHGAKMNKSLHLNIKGQGFYILRNKREIAAALEFPDIFRKHNDFNLLRIELSFNPELDDLMGINLKKHDIAPSQEVINALKIVLEDPIKKLREEMKKKQKEKDAKNPFIKQLPVGKVEPAGIGDGETIQTPCPIAVPSTTKKDIIFSTYAGDEDAPLFKTSISDESITIYYNICNRYYSEQIIADDYGAKVKEALDGIIKASIEAYVKTSGLETATLFIDELLEAFDKTKE